LSNSLFNNHTDHHHTLKTAAVSFSLPRMQRSHFQKGLRLSIGLRRSIPSGTSLTSVPSFKSAPPRSQVRSEERSRIYINMSCFLLKTSSSFAKTGSGQTCHQKDFKNTGVFSFASGLCGYSTTTIEHVVAAGYRAIYNGPPPLSGPYCDLHNNRSPQNG
jgi:hypothetical protein